MGISSPSLLQISTSPSLSHFLFCSTASKGRSRRAPPLVKGDRVKLHRRWREITSSSTARSPTATERFQNKWDLIGSGEISPDLAESGEISPDFGQTSLVLLRHHLQLRQFCPILVYFLIFCCCVLFFFFFFGGCYGEFFVAVICWCLLLG